MRYKVVNISQKLHNEDFVQLDELFPDDFMEVNTDFKSIDQMLVESTFNIKTQEDFEKIQLEKWDKFVKCQTKFPSWKNMQDVAMLEWLTSYDRVRGIQ